MMWFFERREQILELETRGTTTRRLNTFRAPGTGRCARDRAVHGRLGIRQRCPFRVLRGIATRGLTHQKLRNRVDFPQRQSR
jgi:hypothetical protein